MTRPALPACAGLIVAAAAHAAVPVIGGPAYTASTGSGYQTYPDGYYEPANAVAGDGTALATMGVYVNGASTSSVPVQWSAGGFTAYALPAMAGTGTPLGQIASINTAGVAVGLESKYDANHNYTYQAVRWDDPSHPVVLGNGLTGAIVGSTATGITAAGVIFGNSTLYQKDSTGYLAATYDRPVRWAAGSTTATPLDVSGTTAQTAGDNSGDVVGVDAAGTAYGAVYAYEDYTNGGNGGAVGNYGSTAVRWAAGGTALTELAHATAPAGGFIEDSVTRVRPNGYLAGRTQLYVNGIETHSNPTRWDPDGSVTVLDLPSVALAASGMNQVQALSDSGVAVGRVATLASADGLRPVRWDANTSAPTLLGLLGTPTSTTSAWALGVNDAGVAVGVQRANSNAVDGTAVLWGADGVAVDLNAYIDASSGWRLIEADSITDSGWVAGVGLYDPDGAGPAAAYDRSFLIQVPEPTALGGLTLGLLALRRVRRGIR